jgi:hypothetical protein
MHPQVADQAAGAVVGDKDRMMVAMEDRLEPVRRIANLVPIEAARESMVSW